MSMTGKSFEIKIEKKMENVSDKKNDSWKLAWKDAFEYRNFHHYYNLGKNDAIKGKSHAIEDKERCETIEDFNNRIYLNGYNSVL